MKFKPDLIKKILDDLEKVPVIRYVCDKNGIHHSTFYRWMYSDREFEKKVIASLTLGRERTNDTAESVIITGVNNKNVTCAKFWLSHNSIRYMSDQKSELFTRITRTNRNIINGTDEADDLQKTFDMLFKYADKMHEQFYGDEFLIDGFIKDALELAFPDDPELINIWYARYEEERENQKYMDEVNKRFGLKVEEKDDTEEDEEKE